MAPLPQLRPMDWASTLNGGILVYQTPFSAQEPDHKAAEALRCVYAKGVLENKIIFTK
jgi:hypothetical protein